MTLVLNCLTHDFVVQVSDMRLWDPFRGVPTDEHANKAVVFEGQLAFAFTGLSRLGRENEDVTDIWLAKALTPLGSDPRWIARLAEAANVKLRALHLAARYKRLAFVGAGWARKTSSGSSLQPISGVISNFGFPGSWRGDAADAFQARGAYLAQSEKYRIEAAGQDLTDPERKYLERQVGRCVQRSTGPGPVARLLLYQLRRVAARSSSVGNGAMITSLPRKDIPAPMLIRAGPPDFSKATFLFVAPSSGEAITYAPSFASKRITVVRGEVSNGSPRFDPWKPQR